MITKTITKVSCVQNSRHLKNVLAGNDQKLVLFLFLGKISKIQHVSTFRLFSLQFTHFPREKMKQKDDRRMLVH